MAVPLLLSAVVPLLGYPERLISVSGCDKQLSVGSSLMFGTAVSSSSATMAMSTLVAPSTSGARSSAT